MTEHKTRAEAISKLGEMTKDIRIAMFTTTESDGTLHSRPMAMQNRDFDGDLWFFTGASSGKVSDIQQDQHVNVGFAAPDDNRYVSVSGTASLVRDQAKIKEMWNPILKAWFPDGLNDPDLALLRVDVHQAEYWDSSSSTMVQIAGFIKAIVTGKQADGGENEKINL